MSALDNTATIAGEPEVIARSLWTATASPPPATPKLAHHVVCDVAVVGAGFTGLSAAIHLAEQGRSVTVLDAQTPGWGASGRNGGQVIAGLKEDPAALLRLMGPTLGRRMIHLVGDAPDLVFRLIDRYRIACADRRTGWLQPAADQASLRQQRQRAAEWAVHGTELALLDRSAMTAKLGSTFYQGGLHDPRGGTVHPLNYATGLARAAMGLGVRLHGHSAATKLERMADGWRVHTAGGSVAAGQILLCTNGYSDALWPGLAQTVVPLRSVQVATAPLGHNLRQSILGHGQSASDARRLVVYFRLDPDGRFVIGGRGDYDERGTRAGQARLKIIAGKLFPQLGEAVVADGWPYHWGGFVAMTADHLPHLHAPAQGILAGLGYNGRGVAMATAMGKVLADKAMGMPDLDLDFKMSRLEPLPFHGLRKPAVRAMIAWAGVKDRLGI